MAAIAVGVARSAAQAVAAQTAKGNGASGRRQARRNRLRCFPAPVVRLAPSVPQSTTLDPERLAAPGARSRAWLRGSSHGRL
jgi:hypothetical protein